MKGIILSGGLGTRLRPLTNVVSKQLLPVYDKPMIYYPMATLMEAGIREIALISTPTALPLFRDLFGNGSYFGVQMTYIEQEKPAGIAQTFILAENFINNDYCTLILGDNIFHGDDRLAESIDTPGPFGCNLFGYQVADPTRYGIARIERYRLAEIVEKPSWEAAPSNTAITGLYCYNETVVQRAKDLKPSRRGELEITDLNNTYIKDKTATLFDIKGAWLDMGSPEGLLQASNYVQTIQERQGVQIGCLEEIAYKKGWINAQEISNAVKFHQGTNYGDHLLRLI